MTDEPRRCGAKTKQGGTCQRVPAPFFSRCYIHGGSGQRAEGAARRRSVEARARKALADLGQAEPVTDPVAALEQLAGDAMALVDVMRNQVGDLESVRAQGELGAEFVRAEMQVFLQAIARAESILANIVRLDLEGRKVRLAEAQVAVVVAALTRVLAHSSLGIDSDKQREARALLVAELTPITPIEPTATERPS